MGRKTDFEQEPDWDRREWVGEGQGEPRTTERAEEAMPDEPVSPRWDKGEWVGEGQGGDASVAARTHMAAPRDEEPGEVAISGEGHPPSEQHWARTEPPHHREPDAAERDPSHPGD